MVSIVQNSTLANSAKKSLLLVLSPAVAHNPHDTQHNSDFLPQLMKLAATYLRIKAYNERNCSPAVYAGRETSMGFYRREKRPTAYFQEGSEQPAAHCHTYPLLGERDKYVQQKSTHGSTSMPGGDKSVNRPFG